MKNFMALPKLTPGDQVSVISPSAGAAGMFPWVYQAGVEQLTTVLGLVPKTYSTTLSTNASLQERAQDVMAAFQDPATKAVITTIGGIDQIQLLKHLDPEVLRQHPKPFFGFSDNTHLICYLWNMGIPSYYGGAIMTQYAYQGGLQPFTEQFLRYALFDSGEHELTSSDLYNDIGLDWADKSNMHKTRHTEPNEGWYWDGEADVVGTLWGGCVESMVAQLGVNSYLPLDKDLDGTILFLETSEEIPDPWVVMYVLISMGERGWFDRFQAVLIGRPKAWHLYGAGNQKTTEEKAAYKTEQRDTILRTIRQYNKSIPIVQNLDFGHTDPQVCLPVGNRSRIDSTHQKIFLNY